MPRLAILALAALAVMTPADSGGLPPAPLAPPVRNIILLIADGCGYNHVDAASFYEHGRTGLQVYEQFPVRVGMSTYAYEGDYNPKRIWSSSDHCRRNATDSAAAITAMTTGAKTRNGRLCISADGEPITTLIDRMERAGKATGVVSSVEFCHATPAGLVVQNKDRHDYAGIASAMIEQSPVDVIMGAGHPLFDRRGEPADQPSYEYVGGAVLWQSLVSGQAGADADGDGAPDAWTLIQDRAEFQALMNGPAPRRVFGLAPIRCTLQQERRGDHLAAPFAEPQIETVPTLAEMARAALNVLDEDKDGFFVMIEGGAVDWAAHDGQSGRMIEEMLAFNRTVEAMVSWVEAHSSWRETLMIVTGDHECGFLTGPALERGDAQDRLPVYWADPIWARLINHGQGRVPGMQWQKGDHTNSLIPLYAKGAGSERFEAHADQEDPVRGAYLDNSELGKILCELATTAAVAAEEAAVGAARVKGSGR